MKEEQYNLNQNQSNRRTHLVISTISPLSAKWQVLSLSQLLLFLHLTVMADDDKKKLK